MDLCSISANKNDETRLYIGNLDFRINEGALIKMFSPYGKIISEDFLWHNRGPKQGEPRGYAFVQYSTKEVNPSSTCPQSLVSYLVKRDVDLRREVSMQEAKFAKEKMNGRLACGRPLVVRLASEKLPEEIGTQKADIAKWSNCRFIIGSASSPTCKSAKIAAIKSKLKDLEEEDKRPKKAKHH